DAADVAIDGGEGFDTVFVQGSAGVTADLSAGIERAFGGDGNDVLDALAASAGVEIHGGAGNDTIFGGGGTDALHGDSGNDTIYGDDGEDSLYGDDGDNTLHIDGNDKTID